MENKPTRTGELLLIAIALFPLSYALYLWPTLPETIPIHFDASGKADGWGSKSTVFLFTGVCIFIYLLLKYLPGIDPKKKINTHSRQFFRLRLVTGIFLALMNVGIIYSAVAQETERAMSLVMTAVCLLLAGIGNYLPNLKPNYFFGIRTPWTLENNEVWIQTHRFSGGWWFWGGIGGAILTLILPTEYQTYVVLVLALGLALLSTGYSYVAFRRLKRGQ